MGERRDTVQGPIRMWLTVFHGQVPTETVEVSGARFLIGRGESCDLVLDDSRVSREHAAIVPAHGPFRAIEDLGSANGTLVNGKPLRSPTGFVSGPAKAKATALRGGDWVLGDTAVHVSLTDPSQMPPKPSTGPGPEAQEQPG